MKKSKENINFGLQPVSNRFLKSQNEKVPFFNLQISWNRSIGCPQLINPWPIEELRPQVEWITCYEPENHLDELCDLIVNIKSPTDNTDVAGYSFKDESTLSRLNKLGYSKQWLIDPQHDLDITNSLSGIETLQSVFTKHKARLIAKKKGKVDILIVRHVVEHAYDLTEFINSLKLLVKDDGYIIFELPDCEKAFRNGDCTTIWEEHTFYFFESSFKRCLNDHNLEIVFWKIWNYSLENCMVAIVKKSHVVKPKLKLLEEKRKDLFIFNNFISILEKRKKNIHEKLTVIKKRNEKICILGAGHLTVAFISLMEIQDLISFVVDDNKNKSDCFLSIGKIPIKKTSYMNFKIVKFCLLGANPEHHERIKKKLTMFKKNGGVVCSIFPNTKDYLEEVL